MKGALPPSSSDTFLTVDAHCAINCLPTSVEPVNVNLRTSGFSVNSCPIGAERFEVTTLNTPAGMPARRDNSASASADNGVCDGGLITKVQPAANAGPALRVIIAFGKFHGVIAATTPTGCLKTRIRLPVAWVGITSP